MGLDSVSHNEQRHAVITGIVLMCAGIALLTINDAIAKTLTSKHSPLQIIFLRNLIALPVAFAITLKMGGRNALRSYKPTAHLFRAILWVSSAVMFITSIKYLALAEATTLIFVAPLIITAISAIVLKEHVGWRRWSAVVVGFVGLIIVIRPGSSTFHLVSLLPIGAAFLYAILMLGARWLDVRDSVWTLMLYLTASGALISGIFMPFVWVEVQASDLWLFFSLAVVGTAGMTMLTQAFRFAPAVVIAPFEYTAILWAVILGWLFWKDVPDTLTFLGGAIIILSGIYIVWREGATKAA